MDRDELVVIYLSGVTNDRIEAQLIEDGVGLMCNAGNGYYLRADRYPSWAIDIVGMRNNIDPDVGLARLETMDRSRCLFVTAPDAYPSAAESLRRGLSFAEEIRALGYPVAIVAQDGAEALSWPWDDIDCLFVGGEQRTPGWQEWKESEAAARLVREAREAGKWVHMGRVNSLRRMYRAREMGCLSADGTYLKYRKRSRAGESEDARHMRGESEIGRWIKWMRDNPMLTRFEVPSHPAHRRQAV